MKTKKMSLANIQGKLSRTEMKKIMAGSGVSENCNCNSKDDCSGTTPCCVGGCTVSSGKQGVCHTECA